MMIVRGQTVGLEVTGLFCGDKQIKDNRLILAGQTVAISRRS